VVNIEALACGTPVAAYPVPGPKDIVEPGLT
jgi:glycosyltransferase involved in cell wall biosynthesis